MVSTILEHPVQIDNLKLLFKNGEMKELNYLFNFTRNNTTYGFKNDYLFSHHGFKQYTNFNYNLLFSDYNQLLIKNDKFVNFHKLYVNNTSLMNKLDTNVIQKTYEYYECHKYIDSSRRIDCFNYFKKNTMIITQFLKDKK